MVSRIKRSSYVTDTESSSDDNVYYNSTNRNKRFRAHVRDTKTLNKKPAKHSAFQKNDPEVAFKVKQEFYDEASSQETKRKCTTKNAVMARENRKRKKMYIENLEDEVSTLRKDKIKLHSIVENQSFMISELRKEIKYMKSVLANSSDIGNLIKNIRCSTGMSVTSSLDKSLTLNNDCLSKHKTNISRKTAHPWDIDREEINHNIAIPEESLLTISPLGSVCEDFDISNAFPDLNFPLDDVPFPEFQFEFDKNGSTSSESIEWQNSQTIADSSQLQNTLKEHNYTNTFTSDYLVKDDDDDVGVCLHVSKHRVSLEFCPSCSENAHQTWKEVE